MLLPETVIEKIRSEYEGQNQKQVEALLTTYGTEPHEKERERVLLDLLELAKGDMKQVHELIARAKSDYRDIIFWAESPKESRLDSPEKVDTLNNMLNRFGEKWQIGQEKKDT